MLDIISMITLIFLLIGVPIILIILGGSKKTDEEQIKYLKEYEEKKIKRKRGIQKWIEKNIE